MDDDDRRRAAILSGATSVTTNRQQSPVRTAPTSANKQSSSSSSSNYKAHDLDDEFQRAQEMALAVAALSSNSYSKTPLLFSSTSKTAKRIRKAVAKKIGGTSKSTPSTPTRSRSPTRSHSFNESTGEGILPFATTTTTTASNDVTTTNTGGSSRRPLRERTRSRSFNDSTTTISSGVSISTTNLTDALSNSQKSFTNVEMEDDSFVHQTQSDKDGEENDETSVKQSPPQTSGEEATTGPSGGSGVSSLDVEKIVSLIQTTLERIPQDQYWILGMANFCILYLSCTPPSFLNFCTALVLFNSTIYVTYNNLLQQTQYQSPHVPPASAEKMDPTTTTTTQAQEEEEEEEEEEQLQVPVPENTDDQPRLEWLQDFVIPETELQQLEALQAHSTLAERRRFLKARKHCVKAASAQLGTYLQWRDDNRIDEFFSQPFSTDEDDWVAAARGALEIAGSSSSSSSSSSNNNNSVRSLPRLVSLLPTKSKLGARLIHVLPCQLDANLATHQAYALAVAMYLDRQLDRNHTEKVTVVIDIRMGTGWSNPSSLSIVPFLKIVVGLLNSYFPERLSKCILFPLPRTATMLFNTAKSYLDPDTATKIEVCSGTGSISSPVPDKLKTFLDETAIRIMEERRTSFFKFG